MADNKSLTTKEKLLLLGIIHYIVAIVLIIIRFAPFNIDYLDISMTEQTYLLILADSLIMGTIFYALSGPLQRKAD